MAQTPHLSRIHLDAIGGLAGDMFVAALLDTFPDRAPALLAVLNALDLPDLFTACIHEWSDGTITGKRFEVALTDKDDCHRKTGDHRHRRHHHRAYRDIRQWLDRSALTPGVCAHAQGLFQILAEAEGAVHGLAPDDVEFHEVGAVDSIVDFVAAAWLIDDLSPQQWSWSPLPLGGGRINTDHGILPVPAPATALLLRGLQVIDDHVEGERVTPTGAAIAQYLSRLNGAETIDRQAEIFSATGFGFGTRKLKELPNVVRCMAFEATDKGMQEDVIATIFFEIDDQTPEDLAVAIDKIRGAAGVLEVFQAPLFGKKGRMTTQVQVLAEPFAAETVTALCLEETTTLGVRLAQTGRRKLHRQTILAGSPTQRVKIARRPSGGMTAKAEMDDIAAVPGDRKDRMARRTIAEDAALSKIEGEGNE